MALYNNIRGTTATLLQISIGGPQWKASSGVLEGRNSADAAYAIVRGATPAATNDLTTFTYVQEQITAALDQIYTSGGI